MSPPPPAGAVREWSVMATRSDVAPVRRPPQRSRPAPLWLAAAVAATGAAVVSFAPVLVVAVLLRTADAGEFALAVPARVAAAGWLLGHGVPMQVGTGPVGLVPLALTALAGWRVARAGVHVTRAIGARGTGSWRRAVTASGATGLAYGMIGLSVAAVATGSGWWAAPVRAGLTLAVFGFAAASWGSLRTAGVLPVRIPALLRDSVSTGCVAGLLVLAAGAVGAGAAVALNGGAAAGTLAAYGTGVAGQAGLTLVSLAYAPDVAVWAAAYLLGPGFAMGTGTVVRSSEVVLGPLPAVPVLAGLPDGPLPAVGAALLAVPILAGLVAGWMLARRQPAGGRGAPRPWPGLLAGAALSGLVAAVLLGAAAAAAGGPLGAGHLSAIGPVPWQVAAVSAALVTPGAVLGAVVCGLVSRWSGAVPVGRPG